MKVVIDADACIGCGLCVSTCPEAFKMNDDKAAVIGSSVPAGAEESCKRAVDECPVTCITAA